ncbi:MAG: class I SAM-dependent RNA methyltransferase [Thermodesulfobacteriota bacterium]
MRVEIERLAYGGSGIARKEGKVYFVKGGLPRDVVDIRVTRDRGKFAEAVIETLVEPSSERVEPPCRVFHICGGCQLQNLGYEAQLREKENILGETVQRIGGIRDVRPEPIFPSPSEYGYRRRVLLSAWYSGMGWHVGYYRGMSRTNVKIDSCPVADEVINKAIARLSDVLSSIGDPRYPLDRIYLSSDGTKAYITLAPRPGSGPAPLGSLARHLRRHGETENVSVQGADETEFELSVCGLRLLTAPSLFTQSNAPVNEALVSTVVEWAELKGGETVIDLYSGAGNFSIPLATSSERVISVELSKKAVELEKRSASLNGINNIIFQNARCEEYLRDTGPGAKPVDIVVLDPPREGAKGAVEGIARLSPGKVIYVSCDPATLARDLRMLIDSGYRLQRLKPFDMFPQTYHIESLSLLVRA